MSRIYQDVFGSRLPLWRGRLMRLAGQEIDQIVFAPARAFERRHLSEDSTLLRQYVLPQVEFTQLASRRAVWYGEAEWGRVWDEDENEV